MHEDIKKSEKLAFLSYGIEDIVIKLKVLNAYWNNPSRSKLNIRLIIIKIVNEVINIKKVSKMN